MLLSQATIQGKEGEEEGKIWIPTQSKIKSNPKWSKDLNMKDKH